jgi:hypothetical protein
VLHQECLAVIDEISLELRAVEHAMNCSRSWRVEAGPDLFGIWVASVRFGRIGTAGRAVRYEFSSEAEARAFIRAGLRRRQSAKRRIGVAYRRITASITAEPLLALVGI